MMGAVPKSCMEETDPSDTSTIDADSSSSSDEDAQSDVSLCDDLYIRRMKLRNASHDALFLLRRKRQLAILRLRELTHGSAAKRGEPHSLVLFVQDIDETIRQIHAAALPHE